MNANELEDMDIDYGPECWPSVEQEERAETGWEIAERELEEALAWITAWNPAGES